MKRDHDMAQVDGRTAGIGEIESLVECRELPSFEATELETVRRAFRKAATLALRQAWRDKEETHFAPATVHIGWRATSFLVFAELIDADIFNHVTNHNQQTWQQGDTFEIFLRPVGQEAYVEFHVTPNNHRLQLRYPDAEAFDRVKRNGCFKNVMMQSEAFHSMTWVRHGAGEWFVYAEIPAKSIRGDGKALNGQQWQFSFGRYDYRRIHREPVLSSTSAHAEPDFHRQDEWRLMMFKPMIRQLV